MEMNMDDDEPEAAPYSQHYCGSVLDDLDFLIYSHQATDGCSFRSSSSDSRFCSPEISSMAAHVLMSPPAGLLPCDDQYVANSHDTATPAAMAPGGTSAFRRYERRLDPQTKPACGQRMFKTAMSVLAKMHTATRYSQQQALEAEPSGNQLENTLSERKRRAKLKDSFRALNTVLPPGSKKLGQSSILITAREYVSSLKFKVRELEEKNQGLQSLLARHTTTGEKVEIQITRAAGPEDHQTRELCTVKIETPARGNTTDVVLRIVQTLKDRMGQDVSLLSMSTGEDGDGPHRASLTLHLKSASGAKWDEEAVRESVTKAMTRV